MYLRVTLNGKARTLRNLAIRDEWFWPGEVSVYLGSYQALMGASGRCQALILDSQQGTSLESHVK